MRCAICWLWLMDTFMSKEEPTASVGAKPWHIRQDWFQDELLPVNTHDWCGCGHNQMYSTPWRHTPYLLGYKKKQKKRTTKKTPIKLAKVLSLHVSPRSSIQSVLGLILPLLSNTQTPARDTQAVCTELVVSDAYRIFTYNYVDMSIVSSKYWKLYLQWWSIQVCSMHASFAVSTCWERALVVRSGVEPC